MRVTSQIFNADIDTLENSKSRCHSLGLQAAGCVKMSIMIIRAMFCILPRVCPNVPLYSISSLQKAFPINGNAAMSSFSYVDSFLKVFPTFLNFPVGNH